MDQGIQGTEIICEHHYWTQRAEGGIAASRPAPEAFLEGIDTPSSIVSRRSVTIVESYQERWIGGCLHTEMKEMKTYSSR
jgi:hypothetical protein